MSDSATYASTTAGDSDTGATPGGATRVAVDWSGLTERRAQLSQWAGRAVALAAAYQRDKDRRDKDRRDSDTRKRDTGQRDGWLRLVPPVAALGTAFVVQTVAVTDTVGGALSATLTGSPISYLADHPGLGYLAALLLGVAVASCLEGGAAYLMDLYDQHLLARDSVWMLRVAMVVYVGGSVAAIHWWTGVRHLPTVTSWLLAAMSGSALFLWSRGSRWRNRVAMRAAGQLDPALPRLPMAAKVLHPVRWLVTLWLVSWEPVATTDEARARYEAWRSARAARKTAAEVAATQAAAAQVKSDPAVSHPPAGSPSHRSAAGGARLPVSGTPDPAQPPAGQTSPPARTPRSVSPPPTGGSTLRPTGATRTRRDNDPQQVEARRLCRDEGHGVAAILLALGLPATPGNRRKVERWTKDLRQNGGRHVAAN